MCSVEKFGRWEEGRRCLACLDEELLVVSQWKRCSRGLIRIKTATPFPPAVFHAVMAFVPIYHHDWVQSLQCIVELLQTYPDDIQSFDESESVLQRLRTIHESLRHYADRFALFVVYLGAVKLPADTYLQERELVRELLQTAHILCRKALERWGFIDSWCFFYNEKVNTTCTELRKNIRIQLQKAKEEVGAFSDQYPGDPVAARIFSELSFISSRVNLIDNLGDPALTKRDCKNIFSALNLPFDDSVSDDYSQCITFRSAVTLGLFNTTRLRGFIWEARGGYVDDPEEGIAQLAAEVKQKKMEKERKRRAREQKEKEKRGGVERVLGEARSFVERRLGSRLWTQWEAEEPMMNHTWAGCELCASVTIAWVGIPLRANVPASPLSLCTSCAPEYESKPCVHRDYIWLWISHLVACSESTMNAASVVQLAEATFECPKPIDKRVVGIPLKAPPKSMFNDQLVLKAIKERDEAAAEAAAEELEEQENVHVPVDKLAASIRGSGHVNSVRSLRKTDNFATARQIEAAVQ